MGAGNAGLLDLDAENSIVLAAVVRDDILGCGGASENNQGGPIWHMNLLQPTVGRLIAGAWQVYGHPSYAGWKHANGKFEHFDAHFPEATGLANVFIPEPGGCGR